MGFVLQRRLHQNQPRRPVLRPLRGHARVLPDCRHIQGRAAIVERGVWAKAPRSICLPGRAWQSKTLKGKSGQRETCSSCGLARQRKIARSLVPNVTKVQGVPPDVCKFLLQRPYQSYKEYCCILIAFSLYSHFIQTASRRSHPD